MAFADDMRTRLGAIAFAFAGILFVVYPALRPYSDESTLQGAAAFASTAWIAAHLCAVVGFILLMLGLLGLCSALQDTPARRLAWRALAVSWVGAGLTLPYYGAEVFGLNAIGRRALREHNPALLDLANDVRLNPAAIVLFGAGLLLLAAGTVLAAVAIRRSRVLPHLSGVPLAVGFALFLPQFFGPPPIRIAHGLLIAAGCFWVAVGMWRLSDRRVRVTW
jgi:hypothetical protein